MIYNLTAQNIGIGTSLPDASARLDIYAGDKGILIPRVALTGLNTALPVVSPANGLMVYNISTGGTPAITPGFYSWDASTTSWVRLLSANESLWYATATAAPAVNYLDDIYRKSKVAIGTNLGTGNNALLQVGTGVNTNLGFLVSGNTGASSTVPDLGAGSRMMFYPGKSAFRAGYVSGIQWDNAKTGFNSAAFGRSTVASGTSSFAAGDSSVASGIYSFAIGQQDSATANYAVAIGHQSKAIGIGSRAFGLTATAYGSNSTAIGNSIYAEGVSSTAIGTQTTTVGFYSTAIGWQAYTQGNYSTALGSQAKAYGNYSTALGNNTTANGASSTAMGRVTTAQGSSSTAMGFSTSASGDYSTAMGGNTSAGGIYSTAMGIFTTASGQFSTAMGRNTIASGDYSTAMGWNTSAAGIYSTAMGVGTKADVNYATAMGFNANASGGFSTAMGIDTKSAGNYSTASGLGTNSRATASFSVGAYNDPIISSNPAGWVLTDPIFYVGNGTSPVLASNALLVYKNANTDIKGFTRLGDSAQGTPRIKMKKLAGTSAAIEGTWVNIPHGLTQSKILGVNIIMNMPGFVNLPPSYTFNADYEYHYQVSTANIVVLNKAANSANILSKSFTVLITYEE